MAINREKFLEVFDETTGNREQDKELLESYEDDAKAFLPKLQNNNFPLYGLIGEYGTGKSTFLNAVKHYDEQDEDTNNIRITFEARKYPNRKELWDAFIIEILSQVISNITKEDREVNIFDIMDQIKTQMLGGEFDESDKTISKRNKFKQSLGNIFQNGGQAISSTGDMSPEGSGENLLYKGGGIITQFLGSIIGGTISDSKEGVSRIFDYEYFFSQHWIQIIQQYYNNFDKLYIIIEDIDRCGQDGLVFLETLSYFMNSISKLEHNMDKMTCIVSIGQGFLNDNRHLINKAITSYEIFSMKTDSIKHYFSQKFLDTSLELEDYQQECLNNFLGFYLNKYGIVTRSIREIKYLFKKIVPSMIERKINLSNVGEEIGDERILGMILFNFSCFIRSNKKQLDGGRGFSQEIFDTTKGLYFCPFLENGSSCCIYIPYLDITSTELGSIPAYSIGLLNKYSKLFGLSSNMIHTTFNSRFGCSASTKTNGLFIVNRDDSAHVKMLIESYRLLNE